MSRRNGDKARASLQKRRRTVMRAKLRAKRATAGQKPQRQPASR